MKTLVIGLDAATWRVMRPLLDQGKLPNIYALVKEGAFGTLRSTVPPMTPLAWTSIATGVNPGKHGIYDFVAQDRETYRVAPVNYPRMIRPAIWDLFNAHGRKVGVVNFPLAYPSPKVESFFISGIASPENEDYAHPGELNGYLKSKRYRIYPRFGPQGKAKRYFDEVKQLMEIQKEVAIELMKQWEWELFWVVFQGLDWVQHYFWNTTVDGENAVEAFYRYMDHITGQLLQCANDDWNVIILSDHGFQEIRAEVHLNNLLEEWGYLKRMKLPKTLTSRLKESALKSGWSLKKKLPFALKQYLKRYIPDGIRTDLRELQNEQLRLHKAIDWSQTRAFSFGYMGRIYIHREGKYLQGTVTSHDEYKKLQEEIIDRLRSLKDMETGKPIVSEVFCKEDLYAGDWLDDAPDIVFNPTDFAYMVYGDFGRAWFHRPEGRVADHDMEGIVILRGKGIREGTTIDIEAVDIAPTLLYLHGLPVLEDMDGRVIHEAFAKELIEKREVQTVKTIPSWRKLGQQLAKEEPLSEEEQLQVEKRLRDLGYL